ncbi:hypothetical protein F4818DRAFT_247220 [Hypoxylon cercidicola]|nr:hypothetical protein F4818DRAFT_247220 [Hypoxylon cercidicola]
MASLPLDPPIQETPLEEKQPIFRRVFKPILKQCNAAYGEVLSDLQSIRWARGGLWSLFGAWILSLLGLFAALVFTGFAPDIASSYSETTACRSDNSFNVNTYAYIIWARLGFFEIHLGGGSLTFTEAKVIDISWDIIIGRGGQAVLAFISWRVFADYVMTSMEFAPVTYAVFSIIYLQDEPSILSTIRIARAFISGRELKSKPSMVFMILSMLFLIGWPTFASAMTGYTTIVEAFVPDYDGNYVPYADFQAIAYIIHDGERVNLTEDYAIPFLVRGESDGEPIIYDSPAFAEVLRGHCGYPKSQEDCLLQDTTSNCTYCFAPTFTQNLVDAFIYLRYILIWVLWPPKYDIGLDGQDASKSSFEYIRLLFYIRE